MSLPSRVSRLDKEKNGAGRVEPRSAADRLPPRDAKAAMGKKGAILNLLTVLTLGVALIIKAAGSELVTRQEFCHNSQCTIVAFGSSISCLPTLNSDQNRARGSKSHYSIRER